MRIMSYPQDGQTLFVIDLCRFNVFLLNFELCCQGIMGLYVSPCIRTKLSHVKYISYHPDVPLLAVPQIIYELFSGFIESVEVSSWCLNVVIKWEPAFIWTQPLWGPAFIWTQPFLTNLCNLEVVFLIVKSLQSSFSLYSNDYTV